ncbi:MAG: DUF4142 domain-containing protein [Alphaproteobacteria bacterium]
MRPNEAKLLGDLMSQFDGKAISPCLNLGSSTGTFRTQEQRHIEQYIFAPLRERGVRIVHADIKEDEGVDLAGDIYDPTTIPTDFDNRRQMLIDNLRGASEEDFDQRYMSQQIDAHREALILMRGYTKNGDNPRVKSFASKTEAAVQSHLDKAKTIYDSVSRTQETAEKRSR